MANSRTYADDLRQQLELAASVPPPFTEEEVQILQGRHPTASLSPNQIAAVRSILGGGQNGGTNPAANAAIPGANAPIPSSPPLNIDPSMAIKPMSQDPAMVVPTPAVNDKMAVTPILPRAVVTPAPAAAAAGTALTPLAAGQGSSQIPLSSIPPAMLAQMKAYAAALAGGGAPINTTGALSQ
jgi:hypothetical protein